MKILGLYLILLFFLTTQVSANCNFKSGQYIKELQNPNHIDTIQINIPKSAKYAKNAIKIFTSRTRNIPPNLKKRFKASITINYRFGKCVFMGSVRQNGDWKDHIDVLKGRLYRSLNVKLDTGNVASAVQFKLLIPATRNGENEILASLILKRLGIISPDTFALNVDVNGIATTMLFQEEVRKELIEKSHQREGAIFEGDEELLWSHSGFDFFELENISLSRITNKNWFEKGSSSQAITLYAYSLLQAAYVDHATNLKERPALIVNPNQKNHSKFSEYTFAMLAMNGAHALRPHNRKFYFNSVTSEFEPIYYDGNTSFALIKNEQMGIPLNYILSSQFVSHVDRNFIKKINNLLKSEELKSEFIKRAEPLNKLQVVKIDFGKFFDTAISNYLANVKALDNRISKILVEPTKNTQNKKPIAKYLSSLKENKIIQNTIIKLENFSGGYIATFTSGKQRYISIKEVSDIISKNNLNNKRTVFLGDYDDYLGKTILYSNKENFAKKITFSEGIKIDISHATKTLQFTQTFQDDWVLIQSGNFKEWEILFKGVEKADTSKLLRDQRFNKFGLTGCLNIYNSVFQNTKIHVSGGVCEDSINIVNSIGSLDTILITGAFADALDVDFSEIEVEKINIDSAGNDCLDFSSGNYQINSIFLINCKDKGVSVGEKSSLFTREIEVSNTNIGLSSKDLSQVKIINAKFKNANFCVEVKQKKQEFGGAFLQLDSLNCDGKIKVDKNSVFEMLLN
jgi:hypothetical protein